MINVSRITGLGIAPERAAGKPDVLPSISGGSTQYDAKSKVTRIFAPLDTSFQSRAIRFHELLHARFSRRCPKALEAKYHPLAIQACEDGFVHTLFWPENTDTLTCRATLFTALSELREYVRLDALKTGDWNVAILCFYRISCQLSKLLPMDGKRLHKRAVKLLEYVPLPIRVAFNKARKLTTANTTPCRAQVLDVLNPLFTDPPEEARTVRGGSRTPDKPIPSGDPFSDSARMKITELPFTEACNADESISYSRSVGTLRGGKLVNAVTMGSTSQLFQKKRRLEPQGTVLIDSSGSMYMTEERLRKICLSCPGATVAYYGGIDGGMGDLIIFAKDGLRYDGLRLPHPGGGNEVDGPALRWLLKQPEPRYIVTDGDFCGGHDVSDTILALEKAKARGQVTQLHSIEAALRKFGASDE